MASWDPVEEFARLGRRRDWVQSVAPAFAENVRSRRSWLRLSQQHVAMTMAVLYGHSTWHQTTVAKVESGERDVKLTEAVALAEILSLPLSELIGEPEPVALSGMQLREVELDGEHPEEA